MKPVECSREDDILAALSSGRWPDRCDDELTTHVAGCVICTDVVSVASAVLALDDARHGERAGMHIPSSAVMWWRAQMRARQEAARAAARPINVAQVVAMVSAAVLAVVALVALVPVFGGVMSDWLQNVRAVAADASISQATLLAGGWIVPALMIGVFLLLAPVAIYFAVADD